MNIHVTIDQKPVTRVEGDIWEEKGKRWTIKNGIKRTVTKMDQARKDFITPLACPKCGSAMKSSVDETMWSIYKSCLNCVVAVEHEIRKAGKWEEYEKAKILANANSYLKDLQDFFTEHAANTATNAHVTEDGIIEKWKDNVQSHVEDIGNTVVKELTNKVNIYKDL